MIVLSSNIFLIYKKRPITGLKTRLAGFEPTIVRVRTVCVTNFATAV